MLYLIERFKKSQGIPTERTSRVGLQSNTNTHTQIRIRFNEYTCSNQEVELKGNETQG